MDIIVASRNPGKCREFQEIMALHGADHMRLIAAGAEAPEVAETARTYRSNARLKAVAYALQYTMPALGDDSGLSVDALVGAPGLRTARFGGPGLSPAQRIDLLLERLRGVPPERRGAHFFCALYLAFPGGAALSAQGLVRGRIAEQPAGAQGFGYDPIFLVPQLGVTLAELSPADKHRISHRGKAVRHLLRRLDGPGTGSIRFT